VQSYQIAALALLGIFLAVIIYMVVDWIIKRKS
jgi:hypothetical protein